MNLIIETDIGRDADDFFALCYFVAAGAKIKAITITPGDSDQVAVAKFLLKELGIDAPVGIPDPSRTKSSSTPFHTDFLRGYKYPVTAKHDGLGHEIIYQVRKDDPDVQLFVCGPVSNVAEFFRKHSMGFCQATMQGGFCSYRIQDIVDPLYQAPWRADAIRLPKFMGLETCPTFNLNGDKEGGLDFIGHPLIKRRFVGKNVCHSVVFDKEKNTMFSEEDLKKNRALQIFHEAGGFYFSKHPEKKFHDPTAAVCHMHPEIAHWVKGKLYRKEGKWGTHLVEDGDDICIELDRDALWLHMLSGT